MHKLILADNSGAFRNSRQQVGRDSKHKLPCSVLEGILAPSGPQLTIKTQALPPLPTANLQQQMCSQDGNDSSESGWVSGILHCSQLLIPPPQLEKISPVPTHTHLPAALVGVLPACCGQRQPIPAGCRAPWLALLGRQQGNAAVSCFASRAWRAGAAVEGDQAAPEGAVTCPSSTPSKAQLVVSALKALHKCYCGKAIVLQAGPFLQGLLSSQLWLLSRMCGHFCGCTEPARWWEETVCSLASFGHFADLFGSWKQCSRWLRRTVEGRWREK